MIWATNAGIIKGKTMLMKIPPLLKPSSIAASSISSGIVRMYWSMKNMQTVPPNIPGMTTGKGVPSHL